MSNVLGIHDGHNCGATLVRDGYVVASINEERLTRKKNEVGYPRKAIEAVMLVGGVQPSELTHVVYASRFMHRKEYLTDITPWYRTGWREQERAKQESPAYRAAVFEQRKSERIADVINHLQVSSDKISFLEHHLCHLAAGYYTRPHRQYGKRLLGLTCDGAGDNVCATVSICDGNSIERIATTSRDASLGKIYSRVTFMLGMTPWEHEYKVMGLAPYADPDYARAAARKLDGLLRLDAETMTFATTTDLSTSHCYEFLREAFENVRFDVVAGAVQTFTEQMMLGWVRAAVAKTHLGDLVCGGGVFMNVKANMLIAAMPEVNSIYVMPSAADESLSIGAALHTHYQHTKSTDHSRSELTNLYLGQQNSSSDSDRAARALKDTAAVTVSEHDDPSDEIAKDLQAGRIVARCAGRMEWGARALGNRSILSSAEDWRVVDRINAAIKMRDFWMPFAPSVLEECAADYFENPKHIESRFMTLAFPTQARNYEHLTAASHPRDRTIRPQVVSAAANPEYHRIISSFRRRTGRGVVLNTSFNLHGHPIVNTADEAVDVLMRSGLDTLALDRLVIRKQQRAA